MTAPAGVTRDPWGVPTVRAGSLDDLAWAQGRVTAVDRAWQLEVERWRSEATLAAHVGAAGLSWDTFAARARLDDTARRCHEALDPATRRWVDAYVAGVREGLAEGAARSPELQALGLPRGGHGGWRPWTPLGVFLVHHVLFGSLGTTVWRGHLLRSFGPRLGPDLAVALGLGPPDGSNAVAVTGSRTASGLPLVAGDPHRVLERPGVYQQVHLVVDGPEPLDVVGLAFPGVPGVAHFGHTGTVAWAVTNAMAVHQDLYRERLRRDGDRLLALGPDGWEPAEARTARLDVRDGEPVTVETVETARGPVVVPSWAAGAEPGGAGSGDAEPGGTEPGGADPEALSLRAPSRVDAALGFEALPLLLRARTTADVEAALASWVEPVNSVLVADTTGDVRQLVAGRVPERAAANRWHPVPAWDRAHAWRGTCPPAAGLRVTDGAPWDGVAVTANDARPDVAPHGTVFAPPHRAARLRALVGDRTGLRAADLAELLVDTASPATGLLDVLQRVSASETTAPETTAPEPGTPAARLQAQLLSWDRRMAAGSRDAGAFAAWRSALVRRVLDLPLLAPLHRPAGVPEVLAPWLSPAERVGSALERLLDVLPRHGVDVDALVRDALTDAATTPAPEWGATHRLRTVHSLDGTPWEETVVRPADGLPLDGDTDCVLATASLPGLTDLSLRGPVARYVWDLADRDASRWVVPLGADGAPGPHAEDQTPHWGLGSLIPVPSARPLETPVTDARLAEGTHPFGDGRTLEVRRLDPDRDAPLVHSWVREERARFWGMTDHTEEQVREIYAYVDSLDTHHAWLVSVEGRPVGLLQTYQPAADPVGEVYAVEPGDLGIHVLLAPATTPESGFTLRLAAALGAVALTDPTVRRVVVEPDAANEGALERLRRTGFELGPEVELPTKRARLAFLRREVLETLLSAAAPGPRPTS